MDFDFEKNIKDFLSMLSKAKAQKMYGSIELYLEEGNITQITQRIIRKMSRPKKAAKKITASPPPASSSTDDTPLKYQN
jgi:hypothetical protein